jgi:hypothetical protein
MQGLDCSLHLPRNQNQINMNYHYVNLQFTVKSRKQAEEIANICAMFYDSAKVSSVGYIGGYFHDAPAIITCLWTDKEKAHQAWGNLVSELRKKGYGSCIY